MMMIMMIMMLKYNRLVNWQPAAVSVSLDLYHHHHDIGGDDHNDGGDDDDQDHGDESDESHSGTVQTPPNTLGTLGDSCNYPLDSIQS